MLLDPYGMWRAAIVAMLTVVVTALSWLVPPLVRASSPARGCSCAELAEAARALLGTARTLNRLRLWLPPSAEATAPMDRCVRGYELYLAETSEGVAALLVRDLHRERMEMLPEPCSPAEAATLVELADPRVPAVTSGDTVVVHLVTRPELIGVPRDDPETVGRRI